MARIPVIVVCAFLMLSSFHFWKSENTVQDQTEDVCTKFYGNYELRNLIVYNPSNADSTVCITRAPEVNGEISNRITKGSTFEIMLDELNLKLGDPLIICIYHKPGCVPVLVNPEVIDPRN
ncbi:MAG: hypothetical protein IPM77_07345 [Crocinitomicaceae bacterium]|nr:hypothetical protein [Crocinitomicaceae bacterium]